MPKIIIDLVISNRNSFRVLFDKIASVIRIFYSKKLFMFQHWKWPAQLYHAIRYDTRCCFNVQSKADICQINLPHGADNQKAENTEKLKSKKRMCPEVSANSLGNPLSQSWRRKGRLRRHAVCRKCAKIQLSDRLKYILTEWLIRLPHTDNRWMWRRPRQLLCFRCLTLLFDTAYITHDVAYQFYNACSQETKTH